MVLLGEVGPHRDHGAACFGQRDHRREPKNAKQEKKNMPHYGLCHACRLDGTRPVGAGARTVEDEFTRVNAVEERR